MKYHCLFTPSRVAIIENTDNNKCCWGCGKFEFLYTTDGDIKKGSLRKTVQEFLKKLNIDEVITIMT